MRKAAAVLAVFVVVVHTSLQISDHTEKFYKAAVVEFASKPRQEDNVKEYEAFIEQAKLENVDIIVFPENSLHGTEGDIEKKIQVVPDPERRAVPCQTRDHDEQQEVVRAISCAAQDKTIYVVINLLEKAECNVSHSDCPSRGRHVYNTDVVFDRSGVVIARYRKYNLHDEYIVSRTDEPEYQYFDTDFGVRFGVFTSFDIMFKSPAIDLVEKYNITNFVHPGHWYGELPFFTALQLQGGWSYAMDVNLLAAGATKPKTGTGGTGIYIGRKGPPIFSMPDREVSTALISRVPKNVRTMKGGSQDLYETSTISLNRSENDTTGNILKNRLQLQRDPMMTDYRTEVIDPDGTEYSGQLCSGSLCCRIKATYKRNPESTTEGEYTYRAVSYQGDKPFTPDVSGRIEVCAVILCAGKNVEDCGKRPDPTLSYHIVFESITIDADFSNNQTLQMPNILLGSNMESRKTKMVLLGAGHYDFRTKENGETRSVRMTLKDETRNIITFGIYGRDFARVGSSSVSLRPSLSLPSFIVLLVFLINVFL